MAYEKSALDKLYRTSKWEKAKSIVIDRDGGRCTRCGKMIVGKFIVHHHEIATVDNFFDIDNLRLVCFDCHQYITFHDDVKRTAKQYPEKFGTKNVDLIKF